MRSIEGWEPRGTNLPPRIPWYRRRWALPATLGGLLLAGGATVFGVQAADESENQKISRTVPVTVKMGGDALFDFGDHVTGPFTAKINFTDCEPGAIPEIGIDDATRPNSRALELLNRMMHEREEVIHEPEALGIACDSISATPPQKVPVKARIIPRQDKFTDIGVFERTDGEYATYEPPENSPLPNFDVKFEEYINPNRFNN